MSEIIASGVIQADVLETYVETITSIAQEAKLHFNDDGLYVKVVDPANVAMFETSLLAGAFESYESPGAATVGVNLTKLLERLGGSSSGDLVELALDMETRKLHLNYGPVDHTVALIDPDTVRQEPDFPELELPNTVVLTGDDFGTVKKNVGMVATQVDVRGRPDAEDVAFVGEGDTDDVTVAFGNEEVSSADVPEEVETTLSMEYLDDVIPVMPSGGDVTLKFGNEFPALFEWENSEGFHEVVYFQAPRIKAQ